MFLLNGAKNGELSWVDVFADWRQKRYPTGWHLCRHTCIGVKHRRLVSDAGVPKNLSNETGDSVGDIGTNISGENNPRYVLKVHLVTLPLSFPE